MRKQLAIIWILLSFCTIQTLWAETQIELITPEENAVVEEKTLRVTGVITDTQGTAISINGQTFEITKNRFSAKLPLNVGKNRITLVYLDANGQAVTLSRNVLYKLSFSDVPVFYWARHEIQDLATLGVLTPYYNGTFQPEKGVERSELAATLIKITGKPLPKVTDDLFPDVPAAYWGAPYIKLALEAGYVTDYPDHTFKPTQSVTRAEAIAIVLRFAGIAESKEVLKNPFEDVPANHWAAKAINKAKEIGMIQDSGAFKPGELLDRAGLAFMLSKIPTLSARIEDLVDWSTYAALPPKPAAPVAKSIPVKPNPAKPIVQTPPPTLPPPAPVVYKPHIESISVDPKLVPADGKMVAHIYVRISHDKNLSKIRRVSMGCETIGWGAGSQMYLYDDGKNNDDQIANDGIYTGRFSIPTTVKPGVIRIPIKVSDAYKNKIESQYVLSVVSNINGMY